MQISYAKRPIPFEDKSSSEDSEERMPKRLAAADDGWNCEGCFPCLPQTSTASRPMYRPMPVEKRQKQRAKLTDGEVLLASELGSLSLEERNRVMEDIHGVGEATADDAIVTPEQIQEALDVFDQKIAYIRDRKAYDMAAFLYPRYTKDRDFRLVFLQSDRYNPNHAARKFVNHFKIKLKLFGSGLLGEHIKIRHLTPQDLKAMNGGFQIFPRKVRDRSGRAIWFHALQLCDLENMHSVMRATWQMIMAALREMDLQAGWVSVVSMIGLNQNMSTFSKYIMKNVEITNGMPLTPSATHLMYDSPALNGLVSMIQLGVPQNMRLRSSAHFGSYMECMYKLMGYGISREIFPFEDGKVNTAKFQEFVEDRRRWEEVEDASSTNDLVVPTEVDVLIGRGRPFQLHPGNIEWNKLLEAHSTAYAQATTKEERRMVARKVLNAVQVKNGRYLTRSADGNDWLVLSEDVALDKTMGTLKRSNRTE